MASPRQLDFTSSGGVDDSEDTPSRRKSLRITAVKYAVPDAEESDEEAKSTKKTKKKKKSVHNRIWDEEDELTVLKGLVDYRAKTSKIDWGSFYRFLGGSIGAKFSKEQVLRKIRKLKRRFLIHSDKINQGHDPHFTKSSDSEAFGFSMMLWGQNESQLGHSGMDEEMLNAHEDDSGAKENGTAQNVEEVLKEKVAVATVETLNANGKSHHDCGTENGTAQNGEEILKKQVEVTNAEPLNGNGKSQNDNGTENRIARKESHDNDDDDELCAVKDAFETMMSQGLSDYQKKVQLEKLMNLGGCKRRELSDEWKALCVEERRLNVKRLRFSAKLAEAANDS